MMNIGLATCFLDNYGACLQAYALQTSLEKTNSKVEIINYIGEYGYEPDRGIEKFIRNPLFKWVKSKMDSSYKIRNKNHIRFNEFRRKYLKLSPKTFHSLDELKKSTHIYDAYVCGSDQIWNPMLYNSNNKVYFLDFVPKDKKRIAYAPSIGISAIPEKYQGEMRELLNKMDVLSVREKTGSKIVEKLTGRECRTVLDPTLLLSKEEWEGLACNPQIKEDYIFCYIFGEREYIGDFVRYVHQKTGLKLVTIPFTEREKSELYNRVDVAGPEDFVGLIKNAKLVITDSFHATAFSVNLNIPFYTLLRNTNDDKNNMNSRVVDIYLHGPFSRKK